MSIELYTLSHWIGEQRMLEMQETEISASVRVALDIKLKTEAEDGMTKTARFDQNAAITKAALFGARAHDGQLRKNASKPPYFVHCARVFQLLYELPGNRIDTEVFQAALLHDTVEDTAVTLDDLEREFGKLVRLLVAEVSDDKSLPGPERKRLQVEHAQHASPGAKLVKLADKVANVEDLATKGKEGIPVKWTLERVQEYFRWALEVTDGIRDACPALYEKLVTMTECDFEYLDGKRYPCIAPGVSVWAWHRPGGVWEHLPHSIDAWKSNAGQEGLRQIAAMCGVRSAAMCAEDEEEED